jgi:hypothetical protein
MRPVQEEQCDWPTLCAPERTTRSSTSRFLALKLAMSCGSVKKGVGRWASVSLARDTRPLRRPAGRVKLIRPLLRKAVASRAANWTMSAQETTPWQLDSSRDLAASITSNPRRLGLLGMPSFSGCGFVGVGSSSTDASQPCSLIVAQTTRHAHACTRTFARATRVLTLVIKTKQSWKAKRMRPPPMPGFLAVASLTTSLTICSARGHDCL